MYGRFIERICVSLSILFFTANAESSCLVDIGRGYGR